MKKQEKTNQLGVVIVGGGPAGLRAAEVATAAGARVQLFEGQAAVGRKFLVAGRGGLNLTHSEPVENFPERYREEPERWRSLLAEFSPDDLRAWAEELAVDTYVGTSGRVFPRGQKAAVLLRAWLKRLRASGVEIHVRERWIRLTKSDFGWHLRFAKGAATLEVEAAAVVLALGGASWPETGSDGSWPPVLAEHDVEVTPFLPANCGWNVDWPAAVLERAEGLPLKNLSVRAGDETVSGELLITHDGLEGGAIYRLGPQLRETAILRIDFKPQLTAEVLRARATHLAAPNEWYRAWKLSKGAIALLENFYRAEQPPTLEAMIARVKDFVLPLLNPRPIAEAISTVGGVAWSEL
ncbi:MAG: TIGR03862 family flavoprotein, partial [Bryobacteraceae bacterium]